MQEKEGTDIYLQTNPHRKVIDKKSSHTANSYQGFPCVGFLTGKNLFSLKGSQLMKTGFCLCGKTTLGKPCSGPVLALYGIAVQGQSCC